VVVDEFIEMEEGWKANNEVYSVESRTYRVCHISIFEGIVGIGGDRQSFHKCGKIGKTEDDRPEESTP
jgi:hypothetical protein